MKFEGIVHGGMVLIPPEMDVADGTIVRVETDPKSGPAIAPTEFQHIDAQWRQERLEELRREITIGVEQIERGEYTEYDEDGLKQLFERIKSEGRAVCSHRAHSAGRAPT